MSGLTGEEIVKRMLSDKGALKDLIYHIVSDPEMRVAVISAVLSEVATKQDVRDLRQELEQEMRQLGNGMDDRIVEVRRDIDDLRTQISELRRSLDEWRREVLSLIRWTITTILAVWGSTVVMVFLRIIGLI